LKKRIAWLAVARSTYNDFLFERVASKYNLTVAYRETAEHTHPWQFKEAEYDYIIINSNFLRVYQICRKADLLVVSGWGFWRYLLLAILCHHKKRVYWTDTIPIKNYFDGLKGILRRFVSKYIFNCFTQVWSTGQPGCEALKKAGCPESKIRDFPYFVNLDRNVDQNNKNQALSLQFRQAHIPMAGVTVFLGMGQFVPRKRYGDILSAIANLNNKQTVLWLAGDGPEEGTLRHQAERLGIDSHIFFLGWVQPQELNVVYQACDVFVHPAEDEPFGVVILDAMAMGKPVIGARSVGTVADRVTNGINGFVFNAGNIDELAASMKFFLDNPDTIDQFGKKARKTAEQHPVEIGITLLDDIVNSRKASMDVGLQCL
jgi:glycosyltransferase involved in cell wall biosynthesis